MVNSFKDFLLRPLDLGGQNCDALFQFGNGKWIEILLRQQGQSVAITATGQKVVRVHGLNVDP